MESVTFTLKPLSPFRLDLTVWVPRRRSDNLLDRWNGTTYRRALALQGTITDVAVRQAGTTVSPELLVTLLAPRLDTDMTIEAAELLERMLGLRIDLSGFYDLAARDKKLSVLAERFRGVRPPRFPTLFEGFANAIACQQLTLTFGIQLLNRLVHTFGPSHFSNADALHAFARPEDVAGLDPAAFRTLGFSRRKGETLIELAHSMLDGRLDPKTLEALDDEAALRTLCSLRGIGRWSAEYILLRTLGRINVFPGDDVGAQKNLQRWLQLAVSPDYQAIQNLEAIWRTHLFPSSPRSAGGCRAFHLTFTGMLSLPNRTFGKAFVAGQTGRNRGEAQVVVK